MNSHQQILKRTPLSDPSSVNLNVWPILKLSDALDIAHRQQQQQERYEKAQLERAQMQDEYKNAIRHFHATAAKEKVEAQHEKVRNAMIEENRMLKIMQDKVKFLEGAAIMERLLEKRKSRLKR